MTALPDTKPATQSLTIWSAIAAILSGLSTLALVAAGQLGPDALKELERAYESGSSKLRPRIMHCLEPMGTKGLPLLRKGLEDKDAGVPFAAVRVTGVSERDLRGKAG